MRTRLVMGNWKMNGDLQANQALLSTIVRTVQAEPSIYQKGQIVVLNYGRAVIIAQLGGSKATINSGMLMRRRLTITGSTLRPRSAEFKTDIARNLEQKVWPLFAEGKLKPVVYAQFPFEDVQKAHAMMDAGEQIGKIVLTF